MYKHILTYVDPNRPMSWELSLPKAIEFAKLFNTELSIASHVPDFGMPLVEQFFPGDFDDRKLEKQVLKQLEDFIEKYVPKTLKTRAIIGKNKSHVAILKACEKLKTVDLIIIPALLEKNNFHTLGTTAAAITRASCCSVLVVR